jgi:hypothetical protein
MTAFDGLIPPGSGSYSLWATDQDLGVPIMRVFLASCLAAAILATGAAVVLYHLNKPVEMAYASPSVRL